MVDSEASEFFQIISSQDAIGAVLRAHLRVEQELNEVLDYKTGRNWSRKLYGRRFEYLEKVRTAVVFGLIRDDLFEPLQRLGELRNNMAHRIDYDLTEEEQGKFLQLVPKVYRDNAGRAIAAMADEELTTERRETASSNVHFVPGLCGRPAVSFKFAAALFAILFELWCALDDLQREDEEELLQALDEEEDHS